MKIKRRQLLTISMLIIYWPVLFIITHIPIPQIVYQARVSDKALHFISYLILVFLLWFVIKPYQKVSWRKPAVWWVLLVVVWYGVLDEWLQTRIGRMCDFADFVADLSGAVTALVILSTMQFWPAFVTVTGLSIFLFTNLARTNLAELIPAFNIVFHLGAYAFFTVIWLRYIQNIKPIFMSISVWKSIIFMAPVLLLAVTKLTSLMIGKDVYVSDIYLSLAAIAVVHITHYAVRRYKIT